VKYAKIPHTMQLNELVIENDKKNLYWSPFHAAVYGEKTAIVKFLVANYKCNVQKMLRISNDKDSLEQ
jgi:hypothetical protein